MKFGLLQEEMNLQAEIIRAARAMPTDGCSGNVSARVGEDFLITPTAIAYDQLSSEDIVLVHPDGRNYGQHAPSTEWPFHGAIYQSRPDVSAIVHCHSPAVKVVAAVRGLCELPPAHYELAAVSRSVRITHEFDLPGKDLAPQVLEGLGENNAVILANHGQVTVGDTPAHALARALAVEAAARTFIEAANLAAALRTTLGNRTYCAKIISAHKMVQMKEKFKSYGKR